VAVVSISLLAVAAIVLIVSMVRSPKDLEIWDWYDLDAIRDNLGGRHRLMNDLDSTTAGYEELASSTANEGKGWEPIGTALFDQFDDDEPYDQSDPFTGTFEGQGYEIRDLFINRPDEYDVGLFSLVHEGGVIKNVGVVNSDVTGGQGVGGLVGANGGGVSSSYFTAGSVAGESSVGGLVGVNGGDVSNSYFTTGSVTGHSLVGGLLGNNHWGTVRNSHYDYDEVLINGENMITIGALFGEDFEQWLANDEFLDINETLSQDNGYYLINNVGDFKQLLAFGQDSSLKFRLKDDLDLANEPNFFIPYLDGEFHGNGYKISNLSFNFDFVSQVGLFGYLASGGKVSEVGVENANITSCIYLGGVVGWNEGTVSDSYSTDRVNGYQFVGGVVGWNEGTVSNCYSTGNVSGDWPVGGLVGWNEGIVSNCYATGNVSGEWWPVGGLVGANEGTVSDSYATGSVSGESCVGGLVGWNRDTVSNCYSSGNVTGDNCVGGLVGCNYDTVSKSYSTGSVSGESSVGGLVGYNHDGTVSNSYSTASVTGVSSVGGLVGDNYEGTMSNSCWDKDTSCTTTGVGAGDPTGVTGKSTEEMQDIATFSAWDIIAVALGATNPAYTWNIVDGETYPFLSWQSI